MAVARDGRERWELRLGAAQAVTWLGLALGVTVGAYFVGFFSGRYVGFDTARSATVSEVAKLTIQEDLFERHAETGSSDIYSRLDGNAMNDGASLEGDEKIGAGKAGPGKKAGLEEPSSASKFARSIKEAGNTEGDAVKLEDAAEGKAKSEGAVAAAEIDSLFEEVPDKAPVDADKKPSRDSASAGSTLAASTDAAEAEVGVLRSAQKGVRVLGEDERSSAAELPSPPSQQETSLGAILEERVSKARSAQADTAGTLGEVKRPATEKAADKAKAKVAEESTTASNSTTNSTTNSTAGIVKQVLPNGFFAQVAAPKRLQEAQDVARRLKRSGFPVVIETAHVRGEDYFRVLVGPEDTKVQAERLVDQLKRESYLSGTAFLRRVK